MSKEVQRTGESAQSTLDDIVCSGVAIDVYHADQARRLLDELDLFVKLINEKGIGKRFFANLQIILTRHLYLSISRIYEKYSDRNPNRSIEAAVHFISAHTSELQIVDRKHLIDFLSSQGYSTEHIAAQSDKLLSESLVHHLQAKLPKPDKNSSRPLDKALAKLKLVRDTALAHHERVDSATLIVPSWEKIAELIVMGRNFVVLISRSYLNVHHDLERDAANAASSLRRLLKAAGLQAAAVIEEDVGKK